MNGIYTILLAMYFLFFAKSIADPSEASLVIVGMFAIASFITMLVSVVVQILS